MMSFGVRVCTIATGQRNPSLRFPPTSPANQPRLRLSCQSWCFTPVNSIKWLISASTAVGCNTPQSPSSEQGMEGAQPPASVGGTRPPAPSRSVQAVCFKAAVCAAPANTVRALVQKPFWLKEMIFLKKAHSFPLLHFRGFLWHRWLPVEAVEDPTSVAQRSHTSATWKCES